MHKELTQLETQPWEHSKYDAGLPWALLVVFHILQKVVFINHPKLNLLFNFQDFHFLFCCKRDHSNTYSVKISILYLLRRQSVREIELDNDASAQSR